MWARRSPGASPQSGVRWRLPTAPPLATTAPSVVKPGRYQCCVVRGSSVPASRIGGAAGRHDAATAGAGMSQHAPGKSSLGERVLEEFKVLLALSAYLYVCIGAVILFKSATLQQAGADYTIWGIAIVKAVVMAKFMLMGRMLRIGTRYRNRPLIWPTLYHAFMYLLLLVALTGVEELVVGAVHRRAALDSLSHVIGWTFLQGFATSLIMFLVLVPYSAFICLSDALGEREVFRLFFVDRSAEAAIGARITGRAPPVQTRG